MRPVTILVSLAMVVTVALAIIGCSANDPVTPTRTDFIGPNTAVAPTPYPPAVTNAPVVISTGDPEKRTLHIDERGVQIAAALVSAGMTVGAFLFQRSFRTTVKEIQSARKNVGAGVLTLSCLLAFLTIGGSDWKVLVLLEASIFIGGVLGVGFELVLHRASHRWNTRQKNFRRRTMR